MCCRNRFSGSGPGRGAARGFSLVETIVAAAVVSIAAISVIAIVRKGQEQMWVDKHRRAARAIVDSTLEAPRFSPGNFGSITEGMETRACTIDANLNAHCTTWVSSATDFGVPYKIIRVKLHWVEPAGGASDFIALERWVPNIPSPINVAPIATAITAHTSFAMCNFMGRPPGDCSPEWYYTSPWSAVDGIIGGRINGDWSEWTPDADPWIRFRWSGAHRIYKIALYNRTNPAGCWSQGAEIALYKSGSSVGSISLSSGFSSGSCNTALFAPREVDEIVIRPTGGNIYRGFSEIQIYE